jgi:hypothetical protein
MCQRALSLAIAAAEVPYVGGLVLFGFSEAGGLRSGSSSITTSTARSRMASGTSARPISMVLSACSEICSRLDSADTPTFCTARSKTRWRIDFGMSAPSSAVTHNTLLACNLPLAVGTASRISPKKKPGGICAHPGLVPAQNREEVLAPDSSIYSELPRLPISLPLAAKYATYTALVLENRSAARKIRNIVFYAALKQWPPALETRSF